MRMKSKWLRDLKIERNCTNTRRKWRWIFLHYTLGNFFWCWLIEIKWRKCWSSECILTMPKTLSLISNIKKINNLVHFITPPTKKGSYYAALTGLNSLCRISWPWTHKIYFCLLSSGVNQIFLNSMLKSFINFFLWKQDLHINPY